MTPLLLRAILLRAAVVASIALAGVVGPVDAQTDDPAPEPGSELRVWLVTAGPGDLVWERYGHNALRVLDTRTGRDASYNWGIFSFGEPVEFVIRFLQGRMLYMMAPFDTRDMLASYEAANREVVLQELDLTPAEKTELLAFAEINARPENRDYYYQYFLDNCSTRVRDLLNLVLGGRLEEHFAPVATGTSFRWHTRRLTQIDPLIYTGMDALLGAPTDRRLSVWDEMFLPLTLRDAVRSFEVRRPDGSVRPLVIDEFVAVPSTREPEAQAPPPWFVRYLALGLLVGVLFASIASPGVRDSTMLRRSVLTAAALWTGLFGVVGLILVGLLFTDHTFSTWNENLFLANPLLLGLPVSLALSLRNPAWIARAQTLALVVAAIAILGLVCQLLPMSTHQNAMFFALLLPGHLGLAWGLRVTVLAPPLPTGTAASD